MNKNGGAAVGGLVFLEPDYLGPNLMCMCVTTGKIFMIFTEL